MTYYIKISTINKAKSDIDEICRRSGYVNLATHDFGSGGVGRFLTKLVAVARIPFTMRRGDRLFLQYPMKKFFHLACRLAHLRGAYTIAVVHDLGAFRRHKLSAEQENRRLSSTDFLIVHNPTMLRYLVGHGYHGGLHSLQIFDYLSPCTPGMYPAPHSPWRVVYAGNLGHRRNEFLYNMDGIIHGWQFDLYGRGFEPELCHCAEVVYHGFIGSDDFIAGIKADFGLVWDGDSTGSCSGAWGEYLKINDPHKTSFYLRAGLPVIVWSQAAMAPFILHEKVGIAVDSLGDIDKTLGSLSAADYSMLRHNAAAMGMRLAEGYYIKQGLMASASYFEKK